MLTRVSSSKLRALAAILAAIVSLAGPMHLALHGAAAPCCGHATDVGLSADRSAGAVSHTACVVCLAAAASATPFGSAAEAPVADAARWSGLPSARAAQPVLGDAAIRGPPHGAAV